jgi:CRP/FNR family cyclic AMP-dependent transcriptional regulator
LSSTDVLRGVPLFQGMTDRSIEAIADLAETATFAAGDDLVREGEPGDTFLLLVDGTADVSQDGRRIRTLGPGEFLGEISLIDGGPRTATVTATTSIDALAIDRAGFARLMSDWPVVRLDLVSALTQRLRTRAPEPTD